MKIYVAMRGLPYEGGEVIGTFTTSHEAQKCCDEDPENDHDDFFWYAVREHELEI